MKNFTMEDRVSRLEKLVSKRLANSGLRKLESSRINNRKWLFEDDNTDEIADAVSVDVDAAAKDDEVQRKLSVISKSLKDAGLAEFVGDINAMMSDEKGRLALELFAGTLTDDQLEEMGLKHVVFTFVVNGATPVSNLHPTQNEIGFSNSLKKPVGNFKNCLPNMIAGNSVELGIPIITCNGKLIIDGHHRWSQVACVNPDATMKCLDLQVRVGTDGIDFQDAGDVLKVTQALLAAIALKSGKNKLPSSDSPSLENLYALSGQSLYNKITGMNETEGLDFLGSKSKIIDGKFQDAQDIAKKVTGRNFEDLEPQEKAAVYLTSNCLALPKPDPSATLRKYMPQTNGGDDMNISQSELSGAAKNGLNVKESNCNSRIPERFVKIEDKIRKLENIIKNYKQ